MIVYVFISSLCLPIKIIPILCLPIKINFRKKYFRLWKKTAGLNTCVWIHRLLLWFIHGFFCCQIPQWKKHQKKYHTIKSYLIFWRKNLRSFYKPIHLLFFHKNWFISLTKKNIFIWSLINSSIGNFGN